MSDRIEFYSRVGDGSHARRVHDGGLSGDLQSSGIRAHSES